MFKANASPMLLVILAPCAFISACEAPETPEGLDRDALQEWDLDETVGAESDLGPSPLEEFDLQDPDLGDEDQPKKGEAWCFGLASPLYTGAGIWASYNGNVATTSTAFYTFTATSSPQPQNFNLNIEEASGGLLTRVTENGVMNQPTLLDAQNSVLLQVRPPPGTNGSTEYEFILRTFNTGGIEVCNQTVVVEVVNCEQPATWWDGVDRAASWDGSSCEVEIPPVGTTPFIYGNTYYIESDATTDCPYGTWDGTGCHLMNEPASGYIDDDPDRFVITPNNGVPPLCPGDWDWEASSQTCSKSIPWGHWGFVENGEWYLSPDLSCQAGTFDGRNCVMGSPPVGSTALIVNGDYHYQN